MLEQGQLVSDWYTFTQLKVNLLTEGDILEFRRTTRLAGAEKRLYTHWAIYIGRVEGVPSVIHISTPDGDFDLATGTGTVNSSFAPSAMVINGSVAASVRCDPIHMVAGNDQLRINNGQDRTHKPFSSEEVVERAMQQLGTGGYNIITNNCEHFCKYCRYDAKDSSQVTNGIALAIGCAVAFAANPVAGLGVGGLYLMGSSLFRRNTPR